MGLITSLLTWPLAPVRGVAWIAEQVKKEAERLEDELIERLLASEQPYDSGD
jgi:Gas vesicle protein G